MDIYSEDILDHYKHPRNHGSIEHPSVETVEHNPVCGDIIKLQIEINPKTLKIKSVAFDGQGCAISQAAMSKLSETLIGMPVSKVSGLNSQTVYDLLGIEISPARVKCALLGLAASKNAISKYKKH